MSITSRLAALVAEHELDDRAAGRLRTLLDVLAEDPMAPTTVTRQSEGVDVHVADSLTGLQVPAVRAARRIADLGAGAGLPGLVLATALSGAQVALVESTRKKCEFLERTAATMDLENVEIVPLRVEEWRAGLGEHDVVTARALAPLTIVVEYAAPLLRVGGTLVAWKGRRDPQEEADGLAAAAATGLEQEGVLAVTPFPASSDRHLHVYVKTRETPERFPRRAGIARKRPIEASPDR